MAKSTHLSHLLLTNFGCYNDFFSLAFAVKISISLCIGQKSILWRKQSKRTKVRDSNLSVTGSKKRKTICFLSFVTRNYLSNCEYVTTFTNSKFIKVYELLNSRLVIQLFSFLSILKQLVD